LTTTAELCGSSEADASVIEHSWTEPEQFATIFERYFGQIHGYLARRVGRRPADDLAAEVFLVAFAQRHRYDLDRECARPWLYGIATNLVGTHQRQERRFYRALARAYAGSVSPSEEDGVADRVSASAARPSLVAALAAQVYGIAAWHVFDYETFVYRWTDSLPGKMCVTEAQCPSSSN
jgi:DNA-directed RNA polymerase specialized sigma24 family protein